MSWSLGQFFWGRDAIDFESASLGNNPEAMRNLGLDGAHEWTVECNPATVSADKAKLLHEGGVTRISYGVQSLTKRCSIAWAVCTRERWCSSYDILRNAGFERVNLDLMFAIPSQTMPVWQETLRETIAMQPEHLSCYEVIYEQDTPLYEQLQAGEFDVQEELACDMFEELVRVAGEQGFTNTKWPILAGIKDRSF